MTTSIPAKPKDNRYVYGIGCTWNDSVANVALTAPGPSGHRLPCCPHCGSMLFEMDGEEKWWAGAQRYEDAGHPGYVEMMRWAKGKCFPNLAALESAYKART